MLYLNKDVLPEFAIKSFRLSMLRELNATNKLHIVRKDHFSRKTFCIDKRTQKIDDNIDESWRGLKKFEIYILCLFFVNRSKYLRKDAVAF